MVTKTAVEAKKQFSHLLDLAQSESIAITRYGKPAAFIIPLSDIEVVMSVRQNRKDHSNGS